MSQEFYILSLKHSHKRDGMLTWWNPSNMGYTFYLQNAGKYTLEQVTAEPDYYNNGDETLAIPCDKVEKWVSIQYGPDELEALKKGRLVVAAQK